MNPNHKLVLYSAQETLEDHQVNLEMRKLFEVPHPRVAWVPSDFEPNSEWFQQKVLYYKAYDISLEEPFLWDHPLKTPDLEKLFSYDGIHLSGGDTVQFLSLLRANGWLGFLRDFADAGKVLIGISAGAILMTPSIDTTFDGMYADERPSGHFDFAALHLVDFAFLPHHEDTLALRCHELASELQRTLYACKDGAGLLVQHGQVHQIGDVFTFTP